MDIALLKEFLEWLDDNGMLSLAAMLTEADGTMDEYDLYDRLIEEFGNDQ